ncbi:family 20 glycosylhydrolase [Archangium lansingense]|uniref:beta-N-acetylhexosaminidase n=1 Tax=Archangium lansingense TaxID=2995310 RepID=A0ABT3ZWQ7_9BACT|nr:family 20 glycosylhydrolase [Archangium lansinium]MCY1073162.1 carbohydate-binding domain-containing protein [Archangium lansinium]
MAVLSLSCRGSQPKPSSDEAPQARTSLSLHWQPVDNLVGRGRFFHSTLTLENQGPEVLGDHGWKLYFSFSRRFLKDGEGNLARVQELEKQGIRISKADRAGSGDYHVLEPLAGFQPLLPGERRTFHLLANWQAILKTDAPAGFHVVFSGESSQRAIAVPLTVGFDVSDPKQTTRFGGDVLPVPTPELRYAENPAFQPLDLAARLLPAPRRVKEGSGRVTLRGNVTIVHVPALTGEAAYLASALRDVLAASITTARMDEGDARISLGLDATLDIDGDGARDAEGYTLEVKDGRVRIIGADAAGVFYGIQTLRQLVPTEAHASAVWPGGRHTEVSLPEVFISDAPGFAWRGMHLDVARHFQSKETIKKLLDVLAHFKINTFHFHLTDDEGWRLEVPGIPELTQYGARRGFAPAEAGMLHMAWGSGEGIEGGGPIRREGSPAWQGFEPELLNFAGQGSGFYTARDFEEILAYATERHINVIPEIDVPGHARAAVRAMEYRHRTLQDSDPEGASVYRLADPEDTSQHLSVQGYTDNFLNPCLESTYVFLDKVVRELKARYDAVPGARLVAIHGGGDELPSLSSNVWWQGSPQCKRNPATRDLSDVQLYNHFLTRWHRIITSTGARMTGWDDVLHHGLSLEGFIPMPWSNVWGWGREGDAYTYANQGYPVVLAHATNLYLDMANHKDPDEPGAVWAQFIDDRRVFEYRPFDVFANATEDSLGRPLAPSKWKDKERLSASGKKNVLGMQGLLWGENVKTPQVLEYLAFPRMLGVAERAWNPELPPVSELPALWGRYTNSLGQYVLPRLGVYRAVDVRGELPERLGVNYRIPLPGARRVEGRLDANVLFPGLALEYSTDAGATWSVYSGPVQVSGRVLLRTRASDGRYSRTTALE